MVVNVWRDLIHLAVCVWLDMVADLARKVCLYCFIITAWNSALCIHMCIAVVFVTSNFQVNI